MSARIHPNVILRKQTPNCHPRGGVIPSLIVIHSTEGHNRPGSPTDLLGVSNYLCLPSTEAASHVVTDGDGNSTRICGDQFAAWACAGFNRVSLNIEQVGVAATENWSADEYRETARWVALWSVRYHIPLRHGAVSGPNVKRTGVARHKDLGLIGGGHVDPGPHYDLEHVISLAKFYRGKLK